MDKQLSQAIDILAAAVANAELRSPDAQERLRLLGQLAAGLATVSPEFVLRDRAGYGSVVDVQDIDTGEEARYTIAAGVSIELDEGQVSLASPIGQALLGCEPGDVIAVETPRQHRRLRVHRVITIHELVDVTDLIGGGVRAAS